MNSILYQRWWTWRRVFSIGVLCATVLFILFVSPRAFAAKPAMLQNGERLLTVYDRGIEQSFVTKAATVEAALKEAGLTLEPTDRVEPGRDEQLVADSYTINIYRARPVIVVDGSLRKTILTASQSPDQIAKDAGLVLYPEDTTVMAQSQNVISAGAPLEFRITRAKVVELTLYGDTIKLRTQAKTVQDMLRDKNIKLGDSDRISLPLETPIIDGLQLRVWREGKQTITIKEDVDFPIEKIKDVNRDPSYREVKTPGNKGERQVTYEVLIQDGKEVSRVEITSVTIKDSVRQVEIVGAKIAGPAEIIDRINYWSELRGIDASRVARIAKCESTFNPLASNGYHQGLFQHDPRYWPARAAKYGFAGASITDVEAQIAVSTGMMAGGGWSHWECK